MYSKMELDALKEIGNIGAGNAATALSTILSKKIEISVPEANIVPFDDVSSCVGGPESVVVGVFLRVTGDIDGNVLLIIPKDDAFSLTEVLLKNTEKTAKKNFSSLEKSALAELANIVTSSFIVALSNFTRLSMKLSVPSLAFDMAGAILSTPLSLYGYMGDTAFLIDTKFTEGFDNGISLHFLLIPDDESLKILLKSIGVSSIEPNDPGRDGGIQNS